MLSVIPDSEETIALTTRYVLIGDGGRMDIGGPEDDCRLGDRQKHGKCRVVVMFWNSCFVDVKFHLCYFSLISLRFEAEADITLIGMREDGRDIENFGQKFIGVNAGGHLQAEYFFIYVVWYLNLI